VAKGLSPLRLFRQLRLGQLVRHGLDLSHHRVANPGLELVLLRSFERGVRGRVLEERDTYQDELLGVVLDLTLRGLRRDAPLLRDAGQAPEPLDVGVEWASGRPLLFVAGAGRFIEDPMERP